MTVASSMLTVLVCALAVTTAPVMAAKAKKSRSKSVAQHISFVQPSESGLMMFGNELDLEIKSSKAKNQLVCVGASWQEDGDNWQCQPAGTYVMATLTRPAGLAPGRYGVIAHLAGKGAKSVARAVTSITVPHIPQPMVVGEVKVLRQALDGVDPEFTTDKASMIIVAAPSLFQWRERDTRFAHIIKPRSFGQHRPKRSKITASSRTGTASLDLEVAYSTTFAEEAVPQLCVTLNYGAQHSCNNLTTELTIPKLPVGTHHVAVQVATRDGLYLGLRDELLVAVKGRGDETEQVPPAFTVTKDAFTPAFAEAVISNAAEHRFFTYDALDSRPHFSNATIHRTFAAELPAASAPSVTQIVADLTGAQLGHVETTMLVQRFKHNQWYGQLYDALDCSQDGCGSQGQRLKTVVLFLKTSSPQAGAVQFPVQGTSVEARAGSAVVWDNCEQVIDSDCYGGERGLRYMQPVGAGEEVFTLTAWVRERAATEEHEL